MYITMINLAVNILPTMLYALDDFESIKTFVHMYLGYF